MLTLTIRNSLKKSTFAYKASSTLCRLSWDRAHMALCTEGRPLRLLKIIKRSRSASLQAMSFRVKLGTPYANCKENQCFIYYYETCILLRRIKNLSKVDNLTSAPADILMNGREMWSAEAPNLESPSLDIILDHLAFRHIFCLLISKFSFHCKSPVSHLPFLTVI